jgi:hypothetical protein
VGVLVPDGGQAEVLLRLRGILARRHPPAARRAGLPADSIVEVDRVEAAMFI